ncbi:MAG: hypothetical protein IT462_07105 [Planctomycetes bacterium]|nr:hypothetical protein [Planctomycetota bacterium]
MDPLDPRKIDWPLPPAPEDERDQYLNAEALQVAAEGIRDSLSRFAPGREEAFSELLSRCFDRSPAPATSVGAVERLLAHGNAGSEFIAAALANPRRFEELFVMAGHSNTLADHAVRGGWRAWMALADADLTSAIDAQTVVRSGRAGLAAGLDIKTALRTAHRDQMLRVVYHETALRWPVEKVTAEISALADGALIGALEYARGQLRKKRGVADDSGLHFCVLALGKHGAGELNYASDIDIMFVFEGEAPAGEGRALNAQEYAVKLAETMIPLIDEPTEHGVVFRVDTRLRPDGKRGPLARSIEATLAYYRSYGATWERQALIKARPVAGDIELGSRMLAELSGWIYRKYLTVGEINEIKGLKRQIEKRTDDRADTFRDVKHGFGGIRDIEFVTQFLQLLNGGRLPQLRLSSTLPALDALARAGVLKDAEAGQLTHAYRFLRSCEHRLQLWQSEQTYRLPESRADLERVARCMGYLSRGSVTPARAFISELRANTLKVRGLLVRLFAGLFEASSSPAESELVLDPDPDPVRARELLARYGFANPDAALNVIRDLAKENPENRLYAPRAIKYLASMMPALLDFASQSPEADFTLANFERIAACLGAKTILFELIAEDPRALRVFGSIAAQSSWLTDMLTRRPGLVDEFIDNLQTFARQDPVRLRAGLAERVKNTPDFAEALSWQRDLELLRIGLFDITDRTPLPETLREIGTLAEVVLDAARQRALADVAARDEGAPSDPGAGLAVVAMGKLGSRALSYASDLDLVFVYDPAACADAQRFYTRVARRLLELLGEGSERGLLYKVDFRLRPRGRQSSLAVSFDELQRYFSEEGEYWERLALCRARVLFGLGHAFSDRVAKLIDDFCYSGGAVANNTREMRLKLQRDAGEDSLKRGVGGLLDVEFVIQHLQLKHGGDAVRLREPGLFEALEAARGLGFLDARTCDAMIGAYAFLRQAQNRRQLMDGASHGGLPQGDEMETFARRLGYVRVGVLSAADQFKEELAYHRRNARNAFDAVVK